MGAKHFDRSRPQAKIHNKATQRKGKVDQRVNATFGRIQERNVTVNADVARK